MGAGVMMRLGAQLHHRGAARRGLRRHPEQSWCCPEAVARSGVPGLCVAMCCVSVGIEGPRFSGARGCRGAGKVAGKGYRRAGTRGQWPVKAFCGEEINRRAPLTPTSRLLAGNWQLSQAPEGGLVGAKVRK